MKSLIAILGITLLSPIMALLLIITTRLFIEGRCTSSESMRPTLDLEDRMMLEKVTTYLNRRYVRGEIIVFYPPPIEMGGKDLSWDPATVLGRLTGLPFFPYEPAFVKRVIGLPGDRIHIESGKGIFINGQVLKESGYISEPPAYNLNVLADIGGRSSNGKVIYPYRATAQAKNPITVPPGHLFVLGDNRNNSEDSHIFGMIDAQRVIGRVQLKYLPNFEIIEPPKYH
jgi:signal peptidase I